MSTCPALVLAWAVCRSTSPLAACTAAWGFNSARVLFLARMAAAFAVVCRAERGRWRPQADDTSLGFCLLIFGLPCWTDRTRFAAVPDLASPGFHDGGVRSGTVRAAPLARPGRPAGHPRAARVDSTRTRRFLRVRGVRGGCATRLWLVLAGVSVAAVLARGLTSSLGLGTTLRSVTGGEIVAAGKVAGALGGKALGEDEKTNAILLRLGEGAPEMAAAARSMAARTAVKERVKLRLYEPFARMLGVSKAYFEDTFPQEMGAKVGDIPDENFITPPASVAVPALQGLSYTFEEPNLKEMYLNLLAAASDDRRTGQAHPAFAEIIKQLSPAETQLLSLVVSADSVVVARFKNLMTNSPLSSFSVLMSHVLPTRDADTDEPVEVPQVQMWVDNWQRLGLVNVTYHTHRAASDAYYWVLARPEYARLSAQPGVSNLSFDKGLIRTTDFGRQFFLAVSQ
jgi:hypothetical protein